MSEPARDEARFTRPWFLPGVELVSVTYRERSFPEHSHAEWVFGAILSGAEKLVVNGIAHVVNAGQILRLHPDEPHANHTFDARTLRYRVAYISDDALEPYLDKTHVGRGLPTPVLDDATIHSTVVGAHVLLSRDDVGRLEQESALAALTYALFADVSSHIPEARPSQSAVTVARTYIDDHFAEGFGLATLAEAAGLSVFHLAHFPAVGRPEPARLSQSASSRRSKASAALRAADRGRRVGCGLCRPEPPHPSVPAHRGRIAEALSGRVTEATRTAISFKPAHRMAGIPRRRSSQEPSDAACREPPIRSSHQPRHDCRRAVPVWPYRCSRAAA